MSTPIDNEKYPPSGDGAKLPGLAATSADINQLRNVVDGLKEIVEVREGRRGSKYDQTVTWRDLYNVGLVAVQSGGNTYINRITSGGVSAVTLLSPNLQAMMTDEFDKRVKTSRAYKDLSSEIGAAASYRGAPQEVIDILTSNLSDESIKRGADIRTVETKIQQVDKSLALSVRELTAGIDSAQASVREVMYSSANRDEATAGAVTTVNARLNNFGGGGVTVEQKMTATVNRVTGLEGIYSVKVVIDNNGTPYVSGFALSSTVVAGSAATSSFVVNASNFAIYRPGTSSVAPFGVDAGTNTVFINGTLLINSGGTSIDTVLATATSASSAAASATATANAANGTANTANGTANTANGTANSALGTANSANGTATSAYNLAVSADANATNANNSVANKLSKAGADTLTGPISLQASNTILVGTANDGIAIGSTGILGRKTINGTPSTTFSLSSDGSATFSGDIETGGKFKLTGTGYTYGGALAQNTAAFIDGSNTLAGMHVKGGGIFSTAIFAESAGGVAVKATSTGLASVGVYATADGYGQAVLASNSSANGFALVVSGKVQINNNAEVTNLNANYLQGQLASAFLLTSGTAADSYGLGGVNSSGWARIFVADSGTANAAGAGMNFNCLITGYRFRGLNNTMYLEPVSDRRLKENIQPESLGLNFVNALKPVTYHMIGKDRKAHGFIAQDVEDLIQDSNDSLKIESDDGTKGLDYLSLIAPLVKSIQELSSEVNNLKLRIN